MTDRQWWRKANCQGAGPQTFFPDNTQVDRVWDDARALCRECPVRADCLEFALSYDEMDDRWGMYGGFTPGERGLIRDKRMRGQL